MQVNEASDFEVLYDGVLEVFSFGSDSSCKWDADSEVSVTASCSETSGAEAPSSHDVSIALGNELDKLSGISDSSMPGNLETEEARKIGDFTQVHHVEVRETLAAQQQSSSTLSRQRQLSDSSQPESGLPNVRLSSSNTLDWRCSVVRMIYDGIIIAGQPLPPPAGSSTCAHADPILMLLVDKTVADVQPLVQLARAVLMGGNRLVVALLNWSFAPAFEHLRNGLCVLCSTDLKETLEVCKPSVVLHTYSLRDLAMWHEQQHGVPAVMVGFKHFTPAFLAADYPPRPCFKVRNSSDAAFAAELLAEFVQQYVETGIFMELQELRKLEESAHSKL